MSDDWRWADPKGEHFQVRLEDLRAAIARGDLPKNVRVWKPGWRDWKSAERVEEIAGPLYEPGSTTPPRGAPSNPAPSDGSLHGGDAIPPPPMAMVAVQREFEASAPAFVSDPPPVVPYDPVGGDGLRWRKTAHDVAAPGGAVRSSEPSSADKSIDTPAASPAGARSIPKSAMFAAAALLVASVLGLGFVLGRGSDTTAATTTTSTGAPSSTATATAASTGIVVPPLAPPLTVEGCVVGDRHVIVPYAALGVGVEVTMTPNGAALGFAIAPQDGMGILLDANFGATTIERVHAPERIRRVVAFPRERGLGIALDMDRAKPKSSARRSASDLSGEFGVTDGYFFHAYGEDAPTRIFRLDGDSAAIEGIRVMPLPAAGPRAYAFAFKRGGDVYFGELHLANKNAPTFKSRRVETKRVVSKPSLAVSGHTVAVAWAEHAVDDDIWTIALARSDGDEGPIAHPVGFAIPRGGLGERALAPSLAGYASGFALAWTEGPPKNSQVRMQRLLRTLSAKGDAVFVSPTNRNAGEARLALDAESGQGVVAFFAESDARFGLWGAPVRCGRDSAGE